jgi:O-antigen/teichoic acid export membrane protein
VIDDDQPYSAPAVRRGARAFFEGRLLAGAIGFVLALLLVRVMSVEDYAVYVTLVGLQVITIEIGSFGIEQVISRYVPDGRLRARSSEFARFVWYLLAARMAALGLTVAILGILTPWTIEWLNAGDSTAAFFWMYAYILTFAAFTHLAHTLDSLMAQQSVKLGMMAEWIPKAVILGTWVSVGPTIGAAEAIAVHAATCACGALVLAVHLQGWLRQHTLTAVAESSVAWPEDTRVVVRFALQNWLASLAITPTSVWSLRLVAAYFLTTPATAAYGFFQTLTSVLQRYLPVQFLLGMVEPLLTGRYLATGRFDQLNDMCSVMVKLNLLLLLPATLGAAVVGEGVVTVLTGGKYAEYVWVWPWMLLALAFESHVWMLRTVANAVGQTRALILASFVALACLGGMVALLALGVGIPMWVMLVGALLMSFVRNLCVVVSLRRAGFDYRLRWQGVAVLGTLALVAVGVGSAVAWVAVEPWSISFDVIAGLVAAPIYFGAATRWKPFSDNERELLQKIAGKHRFPW